MTELTLERRYLLAPQMKAYDNLPSVFAPYLTFISKPNFRSPVVTIDKNGFRVSHGRIASLDIDSVLWRQNSRRGIVLGGSFTFGWGATHDQYTIPSVLNSITEYSFLNLGIRGANSTQELISSIPFMSDTDCIIVCSGINNLTVNIQSIEKYDLLGAFFFEESYKSVAEHPIWDLATLINQPLHRISSQALVKELLSRIVRKVLPQRHTSSGDDFPPMYDDEILSKIAKRALENQLRDLRILIKSKPAKTRLIFAAQPFAAACKKQWTVEEQELFAISNESGYWQILKKYLNKLWPEYVAGLAEECGRQGVTFIDLNTVEFDGWCFVDNVHMTDTGYLQVAQRIGSEMSK